VQRWRCVDVTAEPTQRVTNLAKARHVGCKVGEDMTIGDRYEQSRPTYGGDAAPRERLAGNDPQCRQGLCALSFVRLAQFDGAGFEDAVVRVAPAGRLPEDRTSASPQNRLVPGRMRAFGEHRQRRYCPVSTSRQLALSGEEA